MTTEVEMNRVEKTVANTNFNQYQDVIIVGVLPNGLLDIRPSLQSYPFIHWTLNKMLMELWVLERGEVEKNINALDIEVEDE